MFFLFVSLRQTVTGLRTPSVPVFVLTCLLCARVSLTVQLKFFRLAGFCCYLTSCSKDLLGKPIVFELVKDFSDVNEIRASYRVKNCPTLVPTSQLNPYRDALYFCNTRFTATILSTTISSLQVVLLKFYMHFCYFR